ncbi:hypothetical protein H072_3748 [Dactylellina haptotyla CBS 200.50]|uniref:CBM1 domain-containing protein n=1 Tax=Dactylellina haptotyla (strain CBS 200.50) TaxID=1284197 RepID=S8AGY3_DACHA|nr:hypothetical protein H072_3748 [Dactylellina haptotyla CBS 200.50]
MAPTTSILTGILMIPLALAQTPTTTTSASDVQTLYGLCGGLAAFPTPFTKTLCEPSASCYSANSFYWHCLPALTTSTTATTTTTPYVPPTTIMTTTTTGRTNGLLETLHVFDQNPYFAQCL